VRAEDNHPAFLHQRPHETLQHARRADVEPRERLVQDYQARVVENRRDDENLLPRPLRIRRQRLVAVVVDAEQLQEAVDLVVEPGIRDAAQSPTPIFSRRLASFLGDPRALPEALGHEPAD
jgi:hypothetical protein